MGTDTPLGLRAMAAAPAPPRSDHRVPRRRRADRRLGLHHGDARPPGTSDSHGRCLDCGNSLATGIAAGDPQPATLREHRGARHRLRPDVNTLPAFSGSNVGVLFSVAKSTTARHLRHSGGGSSQARTPAVISGPYALRTSVWEQEP